MIFHSNPMVVLAIQSKVSEIQIGIFTVIELNKLATKMTNQYSVKHYTTGNMKIINAKSSRAFKILRETTHGKQDAETDGKPPSQKSSAKKASKHSHKRAFSQEGIHRIAIHHLQGTNTSILLVLFMLYFYKSVPFYQL